MKFIASESALGRLESVAEPRPHWNRVDDGVLQTCICVPPPRRSLVEDSTVRLSPAGVASGPPPTPAHGVAGTTPVWLHRLFLHIS